MAQEYEIVPHGPFRHLHVLLVRMFSRTPHLHRELELGLILDGAVTLLRSGDACCLQKGDLYLINPLEAHEFAADGRGALILSVQLSTKVMDSFFTEPPVLHFSGSPRINDHFTGREDLLRQLRLLCLDLAHGYLGRQPGFELRCFSLTAQLLQLLHKELPCSLLRPQDYLPMQQRSDRILSVTDYIEEHFTRKLLLEDLAAREGVSMHHLSHLFRQTLGVRFQTYLKKKRFEYACHLIAATNQNILDISISSGFSDVRYLTRMFQEQFGCTPREYRSGTAPLPARPAAVPESAQQLFRQEDAFLLLCSIREQFG